jgi:hypothetical protein
MPRIQILEYKGKWMFYMDFSHCLQLIFTGLLKVTCRDINSLVGDPDAQEWLISQLESVR